LVKTGFRHGKQPRDGIKAVVKSQDSKLAGPTGMADWGVSEWPLVDADSPAPAVLLELRPSVAHCARLFGYLKAPGSKSVTLVLHGLSVPGGTGGKRQRVATEKLRQLAFTVIAIRQASELGVERSAPTRDSELVALRPLTGPPTPGCPSDRILRLAKVVTGFIGCPRDVRTIGAVCQAAMLFVAPRTFRNWCRAEGVDARSLRDLARLLRAARLAALDGCEVAAHLDGDDRTIGTIIRRGLGASGRPDTASLTDICRRQQLVRNQRLVDAVIARLASS